jgi:hypothetical protein
MDSYFSLQIQAWKYLRRQSCTSLNGVISSKQKQQAKAEPSPYLAYRKRVNNPIAKTRKPKKLPISEPKAIKSPLSIKCIKKAKGYMTEALILTNKSHADSPSLALYH